MSDPRDQPVRGPWDYLQDWDFELFGNSITQPEDRILWSAAVAIAGGLPYIWQQLARPARHVVYGLLELRPGDRVFVVGEALEPSGWLDDIRQIVGPGGTVDSVEIIREARDSMRTGDRGRNGQRGCWSWTYTDQIAPESYDCVAVLQAIQHCDSWADTGVELLRVMKPGRRIVLVEAMLNGHAFHERIRADVHIQQWFNKLFGPHMDPEEIPYCSGEDLVKEFGDALEDPQFMEWRGIETFWGRKPRPQAADVQAAPTGRP